MRALIADQVFHLRASLERFGIASAVITGESTPEERAAFAAKAAEIAAKQSAQAPGATPAEGAPAAKAEGGDASPVETSAAKAAAVEIPIEGGSPASPQTPGA